MYIYLGICQLQNLSNSSHFDKKKVPALGACSGLVEFAGICVSHAAPQENTLHDSVLARCSAAAALTTSSRTN